MNILNEILAWKKTEVKKNKDLVPVRHLEKKINGLSQTLSLRKFVTRADLFGIIAEFKRMSPSKGIINIHADPAVICPEYIRSGASALSVLTDKMYFGGSNEDLETSRKNNPHPILRKDFLIDEYQLFEARSLGADAVLLIAEALTAIELKSLYMTAADLQLEVLFEIHDEANIDKLPAEAKMVGINNRNLRNFEVTVEHSLLLAEKLPAGITKIAESGIDCTSTYVELRRAGFEGFLIGEKFMRETNPGQACKLFIEQLRSQSEKFKHTTQT